MVRHFILLLTGLLLACQSCLTQKIDRTPYQQTAYYRQTKQQIAKFSPVLNPTSDTLRVGWAKVNITPQRVAPMAGYGKRKGKKYQQIHDSVWVRAFVFRAGTRKAAWVTADLLIMPMGVTKRLQQLLSAQGYSLANTYLTATHTHYSFGGWGQKPAGYLMAGKFDKKVVDAIAFAIVSAINKAESTAAPAKMDYQEIPAPEFVYNRLTGEKGSLDTLIRVLQFQKNSGEKALLCTYAAHPTSVASDDLRLSAEYPGALVRLLEQNLPADMVAFGAGAVGSHGPQAPGNGYDKVSNLAGGLAKRIQDSLRTGALTYQMQLQSAYFPLTLNQPQWRYGASRRFRPGLFYLVFGKYPAGLSMLQVGPVVMIGTPCDFSGELLPALTTEALSRSRKLLITSFNGGYIGYVTPEKYYPLKKYETRDMNFFGPYTGSYLQEMIKLIIQKTE